MTIKQIKAVMEDYYKAYVERDDDSYSKLYTSFYIMYSARLISKKQWDFIVLMDHKLFTEQS